MNRPKIRNQIQIPLQNGKMSGKLSTFYGLSDGLEHIAIQLGEINSSLVPLVRIHSECLTGDVFGSAKCDCGPQLSEAMSDIAQRGGYLLYMRQEGRGIGLYNKIDAYALQSKGLNTYAANRALGFPEDMRDFKCAAEMLKALGVHQIELLSNNPRKLSQIQAYGIEVLTRRSTQFYENPDNASYLKTKCQFGGHDFSSLMKIAAEV